MFGQANVIVNLKGDQTAGISNEKCENLFTLQRTVSPLKRGVGWGCTCACEGCVLKVE